MLKLYQGRVAVCAIKVRLTMAEKGIDFEPVNLNLRAGDQHKPEYLKLNPNGVVPTLIHDDFVLIESSVIMQYLDEVFPGPLLQPVDAEGTRADAHLDEAGRRIPASRQRHAHLRDGARRRDAPQEPGRAGSLLPRHPQSGDARAPARGHRAGHGRARRSAGAAVLRQGAHRHGRPACPASLARRRQPIRSPTPP